MYTLSPIPNHLPTHPILSTYPPPPLLPYPRELRNESMAVVLVTHDRYFMENICDRILELDGGRCFMHDFGGAGAYQLFKEVREGGRGG